MSAQLGKALRLARQFHQLSQTDMAERIKISKSYLSQIESGNRIPTLPLLEKFAETLNVPVSSLLMFKECVESKSVKVRAVQKAIRMMEWVTESDGSDDVS